MACSGASRDDHPRRVLVFGIDGATWKVIEPMMEAGELPNIARLHAAGIHGVLRTRPPVISPVVWSTIFTGRPHSEHGVINWKTSQSRHRKVKTIWEIASQRGLETHVFNVPSTWPPSALNGTMISGFPLGGATVGGNTGIVAARDGLRADKVHPVYAYNQTLIHAAMDDLETGRWSPWLRLALRNRPTWVVQIRIKRLAEDRYYLSPCYRTDPGFTFTYPEDLGGRLQQRLGAEPYIAEGPGWSRYDEPDTLAYLAEHLTQVARVQTRAAALFADSQWDLLVYVDTLVDRVSHPYWAYMNPSDYVGVTPSKVVLYRDVVREAYRESDRQLGELLSRAVGDYYVVIVSDHGFRSSPQASRHIGAHDYDGIYLVAGPGLSSRAGARAYIEDIGPTVLHLLGLPVADDMQGRVLREVRRSLGRSTGHLASYEDGGSRGAEPPVDAQTWEQLRGLGYVDGGAPLGGHQ